MTLLHPNSLTTYAHFDRSWMETLTKVIVKFQSISFGPRWLDEATCRMAFRDYGRLKQGYTQVFGYVQASGSLIGTTHRCLSMSRHSDSQPGLQSPTRTTPACVAPQLGLHTSVWSPQLRLYTDVWSPKRAIPQVANLRHNVMLVLWWRLCP